MFAKSGGCTFSSQKCRTITISVALKFNNGLLMIKKLQKKTKKKKIKLKIPLGQTL